MEAGARPPWNHNVAYHRVVLAAVPAPCARALDVGCGTGLLLAELAPRCSEVIGIDVDEAALAAAAVRLAGQGDVRLLRADVLDAELPESAFDLVTAVASLHHLPLPAGLARLAELVRPYGRLVVVGLYRASTVADYLTVAVGVAVAWLLRQRRGCAPINAPIRGPGPVMSLAEIRAAAAVLVPGARVQRRLLFRYTLVWTRPTRSGSRSTGNRGGLEQCSERVRLTDEQPQHVREAAPAGEPGAPPRRRPSSPPARPSEPGGT